MDYLDLFLNHNTFEQKEYLGHNYFFKNMANLNHIPDEILNIDGYNVIRNDRK